ncbi:MAG: PKD domain-containing protein [Bacteroidota bacterium]|nr:PKD domain-containing protein [Bacteroidota bacterium]
MKGKIVFNLLHAAIRKALMEYAFPCCWCLFLLSVASPAHAQLSPANIGFETGTFSGWLGATGQCCPVYTPLSGMDTSRHVITSGSFTDPYSNGQVNVVAPGSLFSARLGNDAGSAESEILDYSFTIPSDSLLLVIRFAVILENGIHPPSKQSRFGYEVSSSANLDGCLSEQVIAGDTSYNFMIIGAYEILNWQTRVINLNGLQGTTINLHFETGDCEPGGHFGYAYVDGGLQPAAITSGGCAPGGSITLFTPQGLAGTWFDGSQEDSITIAVPLAGYPYTIDIAHEHGCTVTLSKVLDDELPMAAFTVQTGCDSDVTFQNNSVCDPGAAFNWDYGDSTTSQVMHPYHPYNEAGTYEVILTVENPDNCKNNFTQTVTVVNPPVANFVVEGNCVGTPVYFIPSILSQHHSYNWVIENHASTLPAPSYIFHYPGIYEINLQVNDTNQCEDSFSAEIVISDTGYCSLTGDGPWLPNAFTPNGDGRNDSFEATGESDYTLTIFNRFGELIYSGNRWDGNKNGRHCPAGIYGYKINAPASHQFRERAGTVVLLR